SRPRREREARAREGEASTGGEGLNISHNLNPHPTRFARLPLPEGEALSYKTPAVLVIPSFVNSVSIARFTLCLQKSFATRTAFLIAFALERPWQTIVIPLIPSSGAPPYSE